MGSLAEFGQSQNNFGQLAALDSELLLISNSKITGEFCPNNWKSALLSCLPKPWKQGLVQEKEIERYGWKYSQ